MEGSTISHYRIIERMGAGGMGVVYRAEDTRLDRAVAVKFLSSELGADENARARFIQEAKSASALDHPNICAIHDIGTDDNGRMYMVMPYYEGVTLDTLVERELLPVSEALGIVVQTVDGLAKAHAKGIVHRDVKPSNLMLTEDGVVKILDFGLAKMLGAEGVTRTGMSVGTPRYMSPEQVRGEAVDHRSDIWSVGVVLYTLLTGNVPFRGEHPQAIMYSVVNEDPSPMSVSGAEVPEAVQLVVDRCLAKDPGGRYQETSELLHDLRALLHSNTILGSSAALAGSRTSLQAALRLEKRREPLFRAAGLRTVGLAALAVAIVAAGIFGGMKLFEPAPPDVLRVLVLPPSVAATTHEDDGQNLASSTRVALIRGLTAMDNVVPLEPAPDEADVDEKELSRIHDAREIIATLLTDTGRDWSVTMNRIDADDGGVLWTKEFKAPYQEPLLLVDAVTGNLRQAYPDRTLDAEAGLLNVDPADYDAFLTVYRKHNEAMVNVETGEQLLVDLESVRQRSPGFIDAYLLETRICRALYENSRDTKYLERAVAVAERAHELAPGDPRTSPNLFDVAIRARDEEKAEAALRSLRRNEPGSAALAVREARLAEHRGNTERAIELMRDAVERSLSRNDVFRLADMEYRHGYHEEARARLETLLERFPDYRTGRNKLAEIELLYGDPARSEALYSELVAERPTIGWLVNLGLARELLGKYPEAVTDLNRALEMAPGNPYVMLNLADCEVLRGNEKRADSLYAAVLESYGESADLVWDDRMVVAQCLAHLGRHREAVRAAQEALRDSQDHSEALYLASIVYAVVGDRTNALVTAERAMTKGVETRWFRLPWFDGLRNEPEFEKVAED